MAGARDVSIRISAQDLASGVVGNIRGQFVQMVSAFASGELVVNGLQSGFNLLVRVLEQSVTAAAEAERVQAQFTRGLRNAGITSQSAVGELDEFASGLSLVVTAEDDVIKTGITLLATLGRLRGEGLQQATRAALDLAAHTGKDLNSSFEALAKFAAGSETALGKMGIKIDDSIPKGERFAAVIDLISTRMGGAAEAEANTLYGRITNTRKAIGELGEAFGRFAASGGAQGLLAQLTEIVNTSASGLDAKRLADITNAARDRVLALASPYARGMAPASSDLAGFAANEERLLTLLRELQELSKGSTLSAAQVGGLLSGAISEESAQRTLVTLEAMRGVFQVSVDLAKQQAADADARAQAEKDEQAKADALERQNKALKEREKLVARLAALASGPTQDNMIVETFRLASTFGTPEDDAIMGSILAASNQLSVEQLARALRPLHDRLMEAWRTLQAERKAEADEELALFAANPPGFPERRQWEDNPIADPKVVESLVVMLERARNEANDLEGVIGSGVVGAADQLASAFANAAVYAENFGQAAKAVFRALIAQILQAIVRMLILRAVFAAFSGGGSEIGFNIGGGMIGMQGGGMVPRAAGGMVISPGMLRLRGARVRGESSLDVVPALLAPGEQVLSAGEAERYRSGRGGDRASGLSASLTAVTTRQIYRDLIEHVNEFVTRRGGQLYASGVR